MEYSSLPALVMEGALLAMRRRLVASCVKLQKIAQH
jgi:hypothetical protein